jgi:hypothetical protein
VSCALALQGLLGDPGNRRVLRRAVARLVRLRRHEHMNVQQALHRLRPSTMPALCGPLPGKWHARVCVMSPGLCKQALS